MIKKIFLQSLLCLTITTHLMAQDEHDAIRYGTTQNFGTARGIGIGSALGSIGGDFSTISVNPGGLGVYRKSELSFSPSFAVNNNEASYLGSGTSLRDNKFNFSQFGLVLTKAESEYQRKKKWKAGSFAIGMNRLQNFTNRYSYTGVNKQHSIVNKWANDFNALGGLNQNTINTVNFPAYAAYEVFLIDRDPNDSTKAYSYVPIGPEGIQQTKTVTEKGGTQEYVIAAGGNYMEKLMLGASLGIVTTRYERSTQYDEDDLSGNLNNDFKYLRYSETLSTEGTGFNLKLGMIYKFNKNFRMGLAVHTPTRIDFTDQSRISMQSHTEALFAGNPINTFNQDTTQAFNYTMNTPYRALISGTFLFSKYGFLTADIEYVDYASMKYNFGLGYESLSNDMNNVLQRVYQSAINTRIGAEVKLEDLCLRAGYAYYGSPYVNSSWDANRQNISAGIGYRAKNWFMDIAFMHSRLNYFENPYLLASGTSPLASVVKRSNNAILTWGWKF